MKVYDVKLTVPLGLRHGELELDIQGDVVYGTIDILGYKTKVEGVLIKNRIQLQGVLKTKVRDIYYVGEGIINNETIEMQLRSGERFYNMIGYLRKEKDV